MSSIRLAVLTAMVSVDVVIASVHLAIQLVVSVMITGAQLVAARLMVV
jgi:hypothetical protein